jgi:Rod binding domain-containing protein
MDFNSNIHLSSFNQNTASLEVFRGKLSGKKVLDSKKLEAAQDFEAMFLQISLKYMRPKLDENSMFNAGQAEEMFYQFQDEAIAKEISKSSSSFGIAEYILDTGY